MLAQKELIGVTELSLDQYRALMVRLLVKRPLRLRQVFKGLSASRMHDRDIAQHETLAALPRFTADEKRAAIFFLHSAALINRQTKVLSLQSADLTGANFAGADLEGVDLGGADLSGAIFDGALLRRAILAGAQLRRASLRNVVLAEADLTGADLSEADLAEADLTKATLVRVDFISTAMRDASQRNDIEAAMAISWPNLVKAKLGGADLSQATLTGPKRASAARVSPEQTYRERQWLGPKSKIRHSRRQNSQALIYRFGMHHG
jgi:hypothetical protein